MRLLMQRLYLVESEEDFYKAARKVYLTQGRPPYLETKVPATFPAVIHFGKMDPDGSASTSWITPEELLTRLHGCAVDKLSSRTCMHGTRSCEEPSHYPPPPISAEEAALKSGAVERNSDGSFEFGVPGDQTA